MKLPQVPNIFYFQSIREHIWKIKFLSLYNCFIDLTKFRKYGSVLSLIIRTTQLGDIFAVCYRFFYISVILLSQVVNVVFFYLFDEPKFCEPATH